MSTEQCPFFFARLNAEGALEARVRESSPLVLVMSIEGVDAAAIVRAAQASSQWAVNPIDALRIGFATVRGEDASTPWPDIVDVETEDPTTHEVDNESATASHNNFVVAATTWCDASPTKSERASDTQQRRAEPAAADSEDEDAETSTEESGAAKTSEPSEAVTHLAKTFATVNDFAAQGYLDEGQARACYLNAGGPQLSTTDARRTQQHTHEGGSHSCKQQ